MANITQVLGAQAALPTTTGTATSFSQAPIVRLYNSHASNAYLVSVVETQSGSAVGSFTMPAGSVEYLRKEYTQCIFAANAAILGAKVGFTN
tara:strand:- start:49 stop:324 length:276 start_codon:yes stop_codon:yes gene_type:complete